MFTALALLFTMITFVPYVQEERIGWFMWRDAPLLAITCIAVAAIMVIGWLRTPGTDNAWPLSENSTTVAGAAGRPSPHWRCTRPSRRKLRRPPPPPATTATSRSWAAAWPCGSPRRCTHVRCLVLGVPMFAVVCELIGITTKEQRYDKLAKEFTRCC
jgi:hypothetical protein